MALAWLAGVTGMACVPSVRPEDTADGTDGGLAVGEEDRRPAGSRSLDAVAGVEARPAEAGSEGGGRGDSDASTEQVDVAGGGVAMTADETAYLQKVVPVFLIGVGGQTIVHNTKIPATLKVIEDHDGSLAGIASQTPTLQVKMGIELRGSSSRVYYAQKPYGFEIRDDQGFGRQVALLGLPKEEDFVLHSCYSDKSCMRNALSYAVAREIGLAAGRYWGPRVRWVEVYLDGAYQGLYLLVEKIKRDKSRVPVAEPAPDTATGDITGGYIFSSEGNRDKGARTWPDAILPPKAFWQYRYPTYLNITAAQKTYLQGAVAALQRKIMANPSWSDTKKFVDAGSWIDYLLMQEVTSNSDGLWFSWYFYKQPDVAGGRFFMGPVWDFDIALGNVNYGRKLWCTNVPYATKETRVFQGLLQDPNLINERRCRYNELRRTGGPLDAARMEEKLDAFAKHIARAKMRDAIRWGNIGKHVWPNNYVGATWADELRYLKYWLRRRLAWLDKNLPGACASIPAGAPPSPVPAPAPVRETAARSVPVSAGAAPVSIPIEGPVEPAYAMWACPM